MQTQSGSLFNRLTDEIVHLQQLNHVNGPQLINLAQLASAAKSSHQYTQDQLIKALDRIAATPSDQYEDLYNTTLHLWINACADIDLLEARCSDLRQEVQKLQHDNGVLLRMLATAHGEQLTASTTH